MYKKYERNIFNFILLTFCLRGIEEEEDDDDLRKVNGLENYEEGGFSYLFSIMMIIFNLHRDTDTYRCSLFILGGNK